MAYGITVTSLLLGGMAWAEEEGDVFDRAAVTYDYARRTTTGVPVLTRFYQDTGEVRTSVQDVHALGFHTVLWRPQNQTLLGHLPALNLDAQLGWFTEDDEQSAGEETGGLLFATKLAAPWSLVDFGWLRAGAGFGFGIGYELGSADPRVQEWHGIDFDVTFAGTVQVGLPGDFSLRVLYENAFFGVMHEGQHRGRVMVEWKWLTVGVDGRVTDVGRGATYTQIGASAGFQVL